MFSYSRIGVMVGNADWATQRSGPSGPRSKIGCEAMDKGILSDREKAMEANYFRQQDAKLLEKLRQKASLDDIAAALAEKLQVDNPDLLARVRQLGITAETAPAFFIAPLVQVAWAEGSVSNRERECVLRLARERGVADGSPAKAQLATWLERVTASRLRTKARARAAIWMSSCRTWLSSI